MKGKFLVLSMLALFLLGPVAWGEALSHYPGWTLALIQSQDGSYDLGSQYFALTPPDGRPAVTIDAHTAASLRSGKLQPNKAYSGSKTAQASKKQDEQSQEETGLEVHAGQYVYSAKNAGVSKAGEVVSTLPEELRPQGSSVSRGSSAVSSRPGVEEASSSDDAASSASSLGSTGVTYNNVPSPLSTGASTNNSGFTASSLASPVTAAAAAAAAAAAVSSTATDTATSATDPSSATSSAATSAGGSVAGGNGAPLATIGAGVFSNQQATGFGFERNTASTASDASGASSDGSGASSGVDPDGVNTQNIPPPCSPATKAFDQPGVTRVALPRGCNIVYVTAWGAGGGSGVNHETSTGGSSGGGDMGGSPGFMVARAGSGAGGAFVNTTGNVDATKYDLLVVVGAPGANGSGSGGGLGGYPGGGAGGNSSTAPGGGGGGFSGVFLVPKSDDSKTMKQETALGIAGGGGGGGGRGGDGGPAIGRGTAGGNSGSGQKGAALKGGSGGNGAAYPGCAGKTTCTLSSGSTEGGSSGYTSVPSDYKSAGGGGGGGGYVGGGGGAGVGASQNSTGGAGGSSVANLQNTILEPGQKNKAGGYYFPNRGNAGGPGASGKVIVQYY